MPEQMTPDELQKMFSLPTQQEANYSPAGGTTDHACSNCRFFLRDGWDGQPRCHLIENWPEPIEPNGVCSRHETKTETIDLGTPIAVVLVEPPINIEYDSASMALSLPKSIAQRVTEFAKSLLPRATPEPPAFQVFKAANGRKAWISRHTGKWVDRENEILAEKSHEAYVERVQKGSVPAPELWMWHAKGTKHGQAVTVWKSGGFVLAAGYFDDTPAGNKAFDYYQKHSGTIKLSHMFHYPTETKVDGVYYEYNTIEITTLPDGAEAFPYTNFQEINTMALPEAAERMIAEALGEDVLNAARAQDSKAEKDTKALDGLGVASKGYDKYEGSPLVEAAAKMTDLETRLKTAEEALKQVTDLSAAVLAMNESIKRLTDEVETSRSAENKALEQVNDLTKRLAEQTELAAPASQSKDTLLNERDKTILENMMEAAKSEDTLSLVEKMVGSKPTVS
jgi:hypothetical protein